MTRTILESPALRALWQTELDTMRERLKSLRQELSARTQEAGLSLRGLVEQRGLFTLLPLGAQAVEALRSEHAIYMPDNGRLNISGLNPRNLDRFVGCLREVWPSARRVPEVEARA